MLLFYTEKCSETGVFRYRNCLVPYVNHKSLHGKDATCSFLSILNPNSRTFNNRREGSADMTTPPSGNAVCRDELSLCRACYSGACRSHPRRTPIPDAISCSGSYVAQLRELLLQGGNQGIVVGYLLVVHKHRNLGAFHQGTANVELEDLSSDTT